MFELVIFDCDGILVDSEVVVVWVWFEYVVIYGVIFSFDEVLVCFCGVSMKWCILYIE